MRWNATWVVRNEDAKIAPKNVDPPRIEPDVIRKKGENIICPRDGRTAWEDVVRRHAKSCAALPGSRWRHHDFGAF